MDDYAKFPSLKDRVIVISGGAQGIGASMVEQFALQGSQVIFLDINVSAAEKLIQRLKDLKVAHPPVFCNCDLTDIKNAIKPTCIHILISHPKIHAVINNAAGAALAARVKTDSITPESWDRSMNVNLKHQFFLTQALLPGLIAAAEDSDAPLPSIINMGSISWAIPSVGCLPYATAKAAVVGLTKTQAHEFGPKGIRVNSIMPGSTATETEKRDVHTPEYVEWVLGRQATKNLIQPEDVARTAVWLASRDSQGITNQSIVVDGGWI